MFHSRADEYYNEGLLYKMFGVNAERLSTMRGVGNLARSPTSKRISQLVIV